jgi:hypothetical protein
VRSAPEYCPRTCAGKPGRTGGAILVSKDKRKAPPRGETHPIAENTTAMRTPEQRETSNRP